MLRQFRDINAKVVTFITHPAVSLLHDAAVIWPQQIEGGQSEFDINTSKLLEGRENWEDFNAIGFN